MSNILITGGGTKVKIDSIRDITNKSGGGLATSLAMEFDSTDKVELLLSKDAQVKHSELQYYDNIFVNPYVYFDEYAHKLETALEYKPDITILAAAVSDYIPVYQEGKIRTSDNMSIQLTKAPKLIQRVKEICPTTFLVGFKLLVNDPDGLEAACREQMERCKCDLVIGNDLSTLGKNHKLTIFSPSSKTEIIYSNRQDLNKLKNIILEHYKNTKA